MKRARDAPKSPISLTVISVMPETIKIVIRWKTASREAIQVKKLKRRNTPMVMSRNEVRSISW